MRILGTQYLFVYREVPSEFSGKQKTGFMYILCTQNQFVILPIFFYLLRLTTLTSLISLFDQFRPFSRILFLIFRLDLLDRGTIRAVELHGLCIEDVGTALRIRCFRNCTAGTARGRVLPPDRRAVREQDRLPYREV